MLGVVSSSPLLGLAMVGVLILFGSFVERLVLASVWIEKRVAGGMAQGRRASDALRVEGIPNSLERRGLEVVLRYPYRCRHDVDSHFVRIVDSPTRYSWKEPKP